MKSYRFSTALKTLKKLNPLHQAMSQYPIEIKHKSIKLNLFLTNMFLVLTRVGPAYVRDVQ